MPTTSVRRRISLEALLGVVRPDLPPVLLGEAGEGEQIRDGTGEELVGLGETALEDLEGLPRLLADRVSVLLQEDRAQQSGYAGLCRLRHLASRLVAT